MLSVCKVLLMVGAMRMQQKLQPTCRAADSRQERTDTSLPQTVVDPSSSQPSLQQAQPCQPAA